MTDYLSQIDFCIKAHRLRPQAERNLVASIRRFYPDAAITINRDDELHTGRNALVKVTERPFLLFLDDDFYFEEFKLDPVWHLWSRFHDGSTLGISAGGVIDVRGQERALRNSGGNLRIENGSLYLDACDGLESNYRGDVDAVPNFFLARRDIFRDAQWRFGVGAEHADFFLQLKGKWAVFQDRRWTISHDLNAPALPGYKAARWDVGENILRFMDHWGIDRIVVNGKVVHSRPMEVVR